MLTALEREKLILNYIPLANKLAWEKNKKTPKCVGIDELKSAAYFGLVDAANKYDQKHGVAFGLYARFRILGEMCDYLRELGWTSKSIGVFSLDESLLPFQSEVKRNYLLELFEKLTKSTNAIGKRTMKMYYIDNRTMREIALCEGLSESRISQIIAACKSEIKSKFDERKLQEEYAY
jgi:RNA polymerase sigma factor (sigma-70 family)